MPAKNNLAHTKRECKYHLAFIPKFRRKSLCRSVDCRPRVARPKSLVPAMRTFHVPRPAFRLNYLPSWGTAFLLWHL